MRVQDLEMLFQFIGGLGLFLYGMHMMADGLQKSAGSRVKTLMGFLTKNRFGAILTGAGITALIQSSSAATVMIVGLVNGGILDLDQAMSVIMGANIGTTATAWIVSLNEWGNVLKPEFLAPLVVGVGAFIVLSAGEEGQKKLGEIFTGFGILFIGLRFMSGSVMPYRNAKIFASVFGVLGKNPFLAVVAGCGVTALIQSSSASIGILQTLAMNGMVNWQSAVFITLGQNIGTCVTTVLSGTGAGKNARRAALLHMLFNVAGSIWAGIVMYVVFHIRKDWAVTSVNSMEISLFHTLFNIGNTVMMLPFAKKLVYLTKILIPDKRNGDDDGTLTDQIRRKLDRRILHNPALAMETAVREVVYMGILARDNFKLSLEALDENSTERHVDQVFSMEENLNQMENILAAFLVELDNLSLTETQHIKIKNLFYTVSHIERIGDHSERIAKLEENRKKGKFRFSEKEKKDMEKLYGVALTTVESALEARELESTGAAGRAVEMCAKADKIEKELRDRQIQRLSKGKCRAEAGVIFLDILSNMRSIADHAGDIAGYVTREKEIM